MGKLREGRALGNRKYRGWKKWDEGDYLIGKLTAFYEDNYKKRSWEVEVIECCFDNTDEEFEVGAIVGINACTVLTAKMEEAEETAGENGIIGSIFKFQFAETGTVEKGQFKGADLHMVDVWLMEDDAPIPDPMASKASSKL